MPRLKNLPITETQPLFLCSTSKRKVLGVVALAGQRAKEDTGELLPVFKEDTVSIPCKSHAKELEALLNWF